MGLFYINMSGMAGCANCENLHICGEEVKTKGMDITELNNRQKQLQEVVLVEPGCREKVSRLLATITNAIRVLDKRDRQAATIRPPKLPGSRKKRVYNSWERTRT